MLRISTATTFLFKSKIQLNVRKEANKFETPRLLFCTWLQKILNSIGLSTHYFCLKIKEWSICEMCNSSGPNSASSSVLIRGEINPWCPKPVSGIDTSENGEIQLQQFRLWDLSCLFDLFVHIIYIYLEAFSGFLYAW